MIEVQLVDGRIIEFPDGTSQDVIRETAKKATNNKYFGVSTEELNKQVSFGKNFSVSDTAKAGLASLVGSVGSIASAFGADNAPAKYLQESASGIQQTLSPERQEEMRRRAELEERASKQGIGQEIMTGLGGVAEAPIQSTVSGIASSVPAIIAGAAALSVGAPAAIAGTVALVAKLAVGALQGAGEAKGNIYETVRDKLMAEKGLSREEAEAQASKAQEYISANAPSIMGSTAAGMLDAVTGVESILGKKVAGKAATRPLTAPSLTGAVARGAGTEALPEAIQGGVGKYGENVALQNAGFDVSSFSGVAGAAARDALMGALTGAAVSPLQMSQLRKEHEEEKQRRVNEETAKIDEQIAKEQEAIQQQQVAKEQEILSTPVERVPEPENLHPIRNPLGNISQEELKAEGVDPYLLEHINEYRKTSNLPPLKSYSVEDIVDAMPGVNPVEEQKQIDTILNSRTGYQGEPISAKDVLDQAAAREIPTDNKSFTDFLNRTTGEADIKSMSNSQLFAAFKAIQNVPQGQELEEGTSSTRFTPQQYKEAIKSLDKDLETAALTVDQVLSNIKETTGLKEDLHAASILNEAVRRGDVDREGDKVSAPTTADKLPEGYTIQEGTFKQGEKPEGYEVVLGEDALPQIHATEEVAQKKAEEVTKVRGQLFKQMTNQIAQQEKALEKSQDALTAMQANGQQDTVPYQKAWAKHQKLEKATNENVQKLTAQLEKINPETVPVSVRKAAARVSKKRGHTVFKGQQAISTHKTRQEAEADLLEGLTDEELASAAQAKGRRTLAAKAKAEMERRAAPPPVKEVEPGKEFEDKFKPLLEKFGLNDVALKFTKDMKSEGEYSKSVIKIALDSANPVRVLRHESVHALKELGFFTPQQWKALEGAAKREWINTYLKGRNINGEPLEAGQQSRYDAYMNVYKGDMDAIIEEAIADAFADFDLNKAPPGLMSAILKRLKLFFEALQNSLTGAGFQTYEDVFGKVERGELIQQEKPFQTIGERLSLLREAYPDETEISTQNPQGVKRIYDPITQMLSIDEAAVREAMKSNPDMAKRTIQAIKSYGFIPVGTPNNKVLEVFKKNIVNNLMFLYRRVPDRIRQRSKLWYNGANKIATQMAEQFDISMEQVAGVMAAMSPQKDWFQNVSMAERALDILTKHGDKSWDENMISYARSYVKESKDRKEQEKRQDAFDKIKAVAEKGTKLNNMGIKEAAAFIRAYDEAYHSRNYRIVTPEGGFGDFVRNLDGKPSTMMWSTYSPIEKTVSIFRDKSRANISQQLGFEHKIRSFYNNIAAPNSDISHVTIDTHAVAAGLFEALAGTDPEVSQNFGATGSSDVIGVGGTYGLIADAYREAAEKAGVRAREMQSITWEAVRGLFTEEMKSSIKPKVRAEWAKYKKGEQSFDETRNKVIEIAGGFNDPDWVGSGVGLSVEEGGTSYDKSFIPEGGVRLREAKELRERLTFNLSAVTNSIPGLRELYQRAMGNDKEAYAVLQRVAESSLSYLLSGTNARLNVEYAKGVYLSDREPSISVQVSFDESESQQVLAALAKFAESYNQQQIHVRQPTIRKPGHEFSDGSYATVVYQIPLKKELNNVRISEIIEQSGLAGFTVTPDTLTAYWVKEDDNAESSFDNFEKQVTKVYGLVGAKDSKTRRTTERLYVYGDGYGAQIPYEQITSDVLPKQSSDTVTPKIIAEYLTGESVTTFKQKPLTQSQVKEQEQLADVFDELPLNDLKRPLVKKAYQALAKELKEQFAVLPIKVELINSTSEPYANSAEMREDVSKNNRFRVYKTMPDTFGPPGSNFRGHPLLQDSGLTDINGEPMLYNDLLRAVHDYFAHNLSETEFGPRGEAAAWRNHMATTNDPMARWALTVETRAQNAWQNFRRGAQDLTLMQRGFADQKASLPPVNFVLTGNQKIDQPMVDFISTLTPEEKLGSLSPDSALAKKVMAKIPTKKLSLRDTDQFKEWFGNSKIVNADGTPKVMYHGTARDISTFKPKQANAIFLTDDIKFAESFSGLSEDYMIREALSNLPPVEREALFAKADASAAQNETSPSDEVNNLAKALLPSNANIMPVYVSAQNPFEFDSAVDIRRLKSVADFDAETIAGIQLGDWNTIESSDVQDAIKEAGFDSFYVKEGGRKNLAVYKPEQIKSATGNVGTFDKYNPDIRYNLRNSTDPAIMAAVDIVTTAREEKGFIERIIDAVSPKSFSEFRAQALNRYNRLGEYDKKLAEKMGGAALYADVSAESAALFSDLGAGLTASALGVHDRNGGIPVYKNGVTTVTNLNGTVKGPVAIFAPLAKYGDPTIYQLYQFWAGAKRGKRLLADGREETYTPAMISYARKLEQTHPEFVQIQKEWIQFNNGLVKFLVDTGVLSKDKADEFTRYSDYIPFYRQMDGENTIGPNIFQAISGVKAPKKLKGSEAPLADFLETVVRNTQSSIQMGIKNVASQRAANVATKINMAQRLNHVASGPDVFVVMENGKQVYYRSSDPLFINAIKSLNLPDLPFIGLLAAPANLLRNLVTKDPGFMLANMVRDSMAAYLTSGAKMTPIASTIANFGKAIAGTSPEFNALLNAGLLGGYEFSSNVEQSGKTMQEALRIKAGVKNKKDYVTGVWQALEKGTTASDAATRMEIYKSTMAETGNEAEALFRAMEVMNFNRKGSSAVVRLLTAAVPFLNARMQGLDVLYRTAFGKNATANAKQMQRAFFVRGMTMFGMSCMYWALTHDDDDYKNQEQETKDNYWLIPALGIKIPTPFEVAIPFKVIPERIMALTFGTDTAKDFTDSMTRQLTSTLMFNPIPQTALPFVEVLTNHSFFTGRDIIGQGMQDIAPEFQVGPGTSLLSQKIGSAVGMSPMKLDHIIKGFTGTIGMYGVDIIDSVLDLNSNSPKVSKRFEQLPVIKRFALDPEARGAVTAYYDLKNSVDEATRTINLLERTGNFEAWGEYYKDNMNLLATKDYVSDLEKDMKEIREMKVMIRSSTISGDNKRDALVSLNRMENQLVSNIKEIRKFALK